MADTLETLVADLPRGDLTARIDAWARAQPDAVARALDALLAQWPTLGPGTTARLRTGNERAVLTQALLAASIPIEPRWDLLLAFAWGHDARNAALAGVIGPERTVAALVTAMPELYDVHAVRLALSMLPTHPHPSLVRATLDLLRKKGFGAQYPRAKAENARLRALLDELAARDPRIAEAVAAGPTPPRRGKARS